MKWNKGKTIAVEIIALILFASLMGCNKNYHVPESQADAGSVHIAVLSVAPWDKYVEDLQPTFDMTTENALKEVIPTTGIIDEKIIDALGAGLKLALPTASVTSTSTVTSETGRETISKTSATKEKKSGDVSAVKGGELSLPEKKPSDISHPSEGVDIDPMTKYLAATALYQEVKLLNRYIKDAAVYCDECTPYVVRLQISLMPKVRNLPYDAYTTISFFDGSQVPKITSDDFGKLKVEWPTGKTNPPFVIPLLVTDNLESILRSSSEDKIRNYTVALSALISGVGLGGNFEKKLDKLKNQKGKDLNSLLTIAKVTENTLRVRLGARQVSGLGDEDHFAMAPRTHNITVLLMVPNDKNGDKDGKKKDGKKRVEVLALTSMVHATEGKELMRRSPKDLAPVIEKLLKSFRANASQPTTSDKAAPVPSTANTDQMDIVEMITYIEMNQWNDF